MHKYFLLFFFTIISLNAFAQNDSVETKPTPTVEELAPFPDSIFKFNVKIPNPKRAGFYSALLPSLGQIYNKQYWKAGIVYVGFGIATYFAIDNRKYYNQYQQAYLDRLSGKAVYTNYTDDDINILRKGFRKQYEYSIIAGVALYAINILDAFTSAHLKTFDMSKDISFHVSPYFNTSRQVGLQLTVCRR